MSNYEVFRECFSNGLLERISTSTPSAQPRRRRERRRSSSKPVVVQDAASPSDAEALGEFIEFLASEIFESLPGEVQSLSYAAIREDPALKERYAANEAALTTSALCERLLAVIPPSVPESLATYNLLVPGTSFPPLFASAIAEYLTSVMAAPPVWASTRPAECEICGRDWVPLTYHHLIPKSTHERALKRGWHEEWMLNSVAWLCRACHSFVHRCASNEDLAKEYFTVERLVERQDVQEWAKWVGRVRWRAK